LNLNLGKRLRFRSEAGQPTGLVWTLIGVVLLLGGVSLFLLGQYLTAPSLAGITPEPSAAVNDSEVTFRIKAPHLRAGPDEILVVLDNEPVPAGELSLADGLILFSRSLADGEHRVLVKVESRNLFARLLELSSTVKVDTVPPEVQLVGRESGGSATSPESLRFAVSEPAKGTLRLNGVVSDLVLDGGELVAQPKLVEGHYTAVVEVQDEAGNAAGGEWRFWVDLTAPVLKMPELPEGAWDESELSLPVKVEDNHPESVKVEAKLNGQPIAVTPAVVEAASGGKGSAAYELVAEDLAEGLHQLEVLVVDRGGNEASYRGNLLVDSSASLGSRPMIEGARGADVKLLQNLLARRGTYKGENTGVLDETTMAAVVAYKEKRGLGSEPILEPETATTLLGRIVIDISARTLVLYDDDQVLRSYRVAVGQPRYPTPTGNFRIINKAKNPTWSPPPSPWADGLEPVPPGPDNPLGTRWMGLSARHVGIHGTYASGSIGTAASHGCIRMHISDVEALFDLVYVGTPVSIVP